MVGAAVTAAIPPLLFRSLLDNAVPDKNRALVAGLALAAVGLAFANALLSLVQRWFSARIGEGLICDLRISLFDHVQHMPIAFFTRAQTGALQSRLNSDVIGAQQAVTSTLGTVVSNVIGIAVTLVDHVRARVAADAADAAHPAGVPLSGAPARAAPAGDHA